MKFISLCITYNQSIQLGITASNGVMSQRMKEAAINERRGNKEAKAG